MIDSLRVAAIIPALNEAESIGKVIAALPSMIDRIIVVDNGSTDATASIARAAGAHLVEQPERGYGAACLAGVAVAIDKADILLFVDADYSDFPEQAPRLLEPIARGEADLVIGSRMTEREARRALPPVAAFGNWLTSNLIRLRWGIRFTDIGPFRAIRTSSYRLLGMQDRNFGWTTEMQARAVKRHLRCREVPVSYRPRIGHSKISGTIIGSFRAGCKFLWIIGREAITP